MYPSLQVMPYGMALLTLAPCAAIPRTIPAPMPLAPPVTMAILPFRDIVDWMVLYDGPLPTATRRLG